MHLGIDRKCHELERRHLGPQAIELCKIDVGSAADRYSGKLMREGCAHAPHSLSGRDLHRFAKHEHPRHGDRKRQFLDEGCQLPIGLTG